MPVDIEKLPDKIKQTPHWRINLQPSSYKIRINEDPKAAFDLVEQSAVTLRGWPYPFVSNERLEQIRKQKYIASGSDFLGHIEYWRLYYSGQFIHLFQVREKSSDAWHEQLKKHAQQCILEYRRNNNFDIPGFIDITNLLYCLTEIFEFVARICGKGLYNNSELEITVGLINIEKFALITSPSRFWHGYYPATDSIIKKSWSTKAEQLLSESADLALKATFYFLSQFGWDNPPVDILRQDQEKFLSGKI